MKTMFKEEEPIHLGHNVQRLREIIGIKQIDLGLRCNGWSQQQISKLEQTENIDDDTLEILAVGLGVTPELIKNFKEEKAIYNIQNNHDSTTYPSQNYHQTINNNDKLLELFEKFVNEDKKKTDLIETLAKTVSSLAEKVEKLKK
ncbi:MAG TPA: helix-turn-helix transcriptional regulator [Arachidicoccus soli]|uniref:XRE family transcriptional regulator n=1 Tax=Arachidicoccus soli TaxID=2341117 RepID=A0A386HTR3_9BACT|nr:helix-turn-helix transcriptional regulator [Arachidicoccus soli]AYD49072.1 XRE family transcriptional regulator [Arachidicoccus soli]HEU0228249.1 helix-turn-helix transcriptional regulator [Arachidicoccus soli]